MKYLLCCVLLGVGLVVQAQRPDCPPPPNNKDPSECCDVPKPADQSVFEACMAKHGPPRERPGPGPKPGCCLAECVFNSTNTQRNGEIDVAALKAYMRSRDNGVNEWDAIFDKNIDECMAESTNMPAAPPAVDPADNCNPKFGFVSMCIMKKNFANCPAKIYKQSAECDELRKYSEKCPIKPARQ